jgi:hypothetical protein
VNPAIEPRRHLAHVTGICFDPNGVFSLLWEISPKNEEKKSCVEQALPSLFLWLAKKHQKEKLIIRKYIDFGGFEVRKK